MAVGELGRRTSLNLRARSTGGGKRELMSAFTLAWQTSNSVPFSSSSSAASQSMRSSLSWSAFDVLRRPFSAPAWKVLAPPTPASRKALPCGSRCGRHESEARVVGEGRVGGEGEADGGGEGEADGGGEGEADGGGEGEAGGGGKGEADGGGEGEADGGGKGEADGGGEGEADDRGEDEVDGGGEDEVDGGGEG